MFGWSVGHFSSMNYFVYRDVVLRLFTCCRFSVFFLFYVFHYILYYTDIYYILYFTFYSVVTRWTMFTKVVLVLLISTVWIVFETHVWLIFTELVSLALFWRNSVCVTDVFINALLFWYFALDNVLIIKLYVS